MKNIEKGRKGEDLCVEFLKKHNYIILEQNFRCPFGEIDIIAKEKSVYVFIEVKTRTSSKYGFPQEAVNIRKQRKIKKVALYYFKSMDIRDFNCRFDVVTVFLNGNTTEILQIKNAF